MKKSDLKKSDLKNFDVVQLRNGEEYIVKNQNILLSRDSIWGLNFYNEDLTHDTEAGKDVVAVRRESIPKYLMFDRLDSTPIVWEREEKIELTQFEREILENALNKGYFFVARDWDGDLYFFKSEPFKFDDSFWVSNNNYYEELPNFLNDLFQFVKWEQEEPMSIRELLKNE